ncbi:hypothetical protein NA57DRAFT_36813 [Rhizodiscina lignyota]|uniref:FCP1 homology domain-containing protein n=1 Tax=Rhizodiscina lignyota TaxID=1504668 RepID=A0A9P4IFG0_9PEZI|nr:hypothetical protein NA57DRAFT_36813 [Rhizodiscina lignyota]
MDEKTPLLPSTGPEPYTALKTGNSWMVVPNRIASAVVSSLRVVITTFTAPVRYVIACFYDEEGNFSAFMPIYNMGKTTSRRKRKSPELAIATSSEDETDGDNREKLGHSGSRKYSRRLSSGSSSSTAVQTDSEFDSKTKDSVSKHTRSKSATSTGDEISPARRSIRIKLYNEDALKQRRNRNANTGSKSGSLDPSSALEVAAASLKSPSSTATAAKMTRYPRTPAPPRPLIPKRQPSYTNTVPFQGPTSQKTLVIDLDETLIHSHSKGGRYTTGHMVEVKMQNAIGTAGVTIAPQVPILYYVHKRPFCDEFLRKVSKWYNLIVFTASVQEYADPVIDWLEMERKYFSGRYYRQHCTQRNGAYIKDLSQVEPDLSKVIIIDNSPVSYIFHEDNAIPIEGWISDPTDNGLLHLVPLLEGLQYATDVRAVLSLRLGQPQAA